jgi:formylglycine-generating enzyme required for sulfatase activity
VTEKVSDEAPRLLGGDIKQTPHPIGNLPGKSPVLIGPDKEQVIQKWGREIANSIRMKLVHIPSGKTEMGLTDGERKSILSQLREKKMPDWLRAEGLRHPVEITEFWLGMHEVTQQEFAEVMGYNPSVFSANGTEKRGLAYDRLSKPAAGKERVKSADTSDFPVENVSWEEANEFCRRLTDRPSERGRKYRLPTEAEWEYACKGGARSYQPFHFGNSLSSRQANFNGTLPYGGAGKGKFLKSPCDVGRYPANGYRLHDMHGNVWEWCSDWYGKDYYEKSPVKDPQGPAQGTERVFRGGAFDCDSRVCRTTVRNKARESYRYYYLGFRVALVPSNR